jgi:hypothetical protein
MLSPRRLVTKPLLRVGVLVVLLPVFLVLTVPELTALVRYVKEIAKDGSIRDIQNRQQRRKF